MSGFSRALGKVLLALRRKFSKNSNPLLLTPQEPLTLEIPERRTPTAGAGAGSAAGAGAPTLAPEVLPTSTAGDFHAINDPDGNLEEKFTEMMYRFITIHLIFHGYGTQKHFKEICRIFMLPDKTLGEKVVGIALQLQNADENPCFTRSKETIGSYRFLYESLLKKFSRIFLDEQTLSEKVKVALGRERTPLFNIELQTEIVMGMTATTNPILPMTLGTVTESETTPTTGPLSALVLFEPRAERHARREISHKNLRECRKVFSGFIANYFLSKGNMRANNLQRILKWLAQKENFLLNSRVLLDLQVRLMDTAYETGLRRKPKTQALYTQLQTDLFKYGFTTAEVKAAHGPYRAAIEEEKRRIAEAQALAHGMM
jgi:hypothetical protein